MSTTATPRCPICQKAAGKPPENGWFPFCSNRCKVIDLSKWLNNEYTVPAQADDEADASIEGEGGSERLH